VIVRDEDGRTLADMEALFVTLQLGQLIAPSPVTIRKHCPPVATDKATGVQLFDLDAAIEKLRTIKPRATRARRS
jgi:hypothetical protein